MSFGSPFTVGVVVAVVVAACASSSPVVSSPADPITPKPLAIGETFRLMSRVLGEQRVINVYLPPGYAESTERSIVL
ncbi:MAG: hypothetical protein AB7O24_23875, partial [Kofleriaceae bacterium]